jgi:hypothetical protein
LSLSRWFIFIVIQLVPPAVAIGIAAAFGWIELSFDYTTALVIFGAYAGWASLLYYLKLREFLHGTDKLKCI